MRDTHPRPLPHAPLGLGKAFSQSSASATHMRQRPRAFFGLLAFLALHLLFACQGRTIGPSQSASYAICLEPVSMRLRPLM